MLYRPNFCCQCGEKIARATWTPMTSRRFCDFCAIEQKQHDLLPRAAIVLALLFGAGGIATYFGGASSQTQKLTTAAAQVHESKGQAVALSNRPSTPDTPKGNSQPLPIATANSALAANIPQRADRGSSSTEPAYYCGAMTKKGTPCTRRVKSPGRCWQHIGQPAMNVLRDR